VVVLGIGDGVDAAAALVVNSQLVGVASQERHDQVPRSRAFPWAAAEEVLEEAGIRHRDVDVITVAGRFTPPFFVRRHPRLRAVARDPFSAAYDAKVFLQAMLRQSGIGALEADRAAEWLEQRFTSRGFSPQRTILVDTHRCLAEAAYRRQDNDQVLVITLHPMGDGAALNVHLGSAGQLDLVWQQKGFATLHTHLARCVTSMGLHPLVDDSRVWGMAARGDADRALLDLLEPCLRVDGMLLSRRSYPMPTRRGSEVYRRLAEAPRDVAAASVYENLRRAVCGLVRNLVEHFQVADVVVGGAIFENPRLCGHVAEMPTVKSLHVATNPGWGALAIGAAMTESGTAPEVVSGSLGRQFGMLQCERALKAAGVSADRDEDPKTAAHVLASGGSLARFSGRAGCGRHGMGSRSVLVRADEPAVLARARLALGRPDEEEVACAWLDVAGDGLAAVDLVAVGGARYAQVAVRVDEVFGRKHPAVVMPDGRVHLIRVTNDDPWLRDMLAELHELTGCSAVAVLPLARLQDPPVVLPADAIRVFQRSEELSAMVLGPFLVRR
jgi:predicted NodU family carbamoyl transferase